MGRLNQLQQLNQDRKGGRLSQLKIEEKSIEQPTIEQPKQQGFFRKTISSAFGAGKISPIDVIKEVPSSTGKIAKGFANTFIPAITGFFKTTGNIIGEGLAYAVDKNVREQYKAGNLDILPIVTETTPKDVAKKTIAAGFETAVYRSFPEIAKMKLLPRGGAGALQGIGFAISEGMAHDKSPEEIIKSLPAYGVMGSSMGIITPYLLPLLKAEMKVLPKEIKSIFKGLKGEIRPPKQIIKEEVLPTKQTPEPLAKEAMKYKTAEEFIGAQPKVFHGTNAKFDEFDVKKIGLQTDDGLFGHGFYFTENKQGAKTTPRGGAKYVKEVVINKDKLLDLRRFKSTKEFADYLDVSEDILIAPTNARNPIRPILSQTRQFASHIQQKGFDGAIIRSGKGSEIVIYNPKAIKTKSQLIDIFKEAKGIKPTEQRITEVSPDILPIGGGKTVVSRLEARMKNVLNKVRPEKADEAGITTFRQMNKIEQRQKAIKYVIKNPEDAMSILRGDKQPPEGLLHNSIALALEKKVELLADKNLAIKLASLRSSRMGQEISFLTEMEADNPISKMAEIIKARTERVTKRFKKDQTISGETRKIQKEINKSIQKKHLKIIEAENILKQLTC